jgi:hypothetical protein
MRSDGAMDLGSHYAAHIVQCRQCGSASLFGKDRIDEAADDE